MLKKKQIGEQLRGLGKILKMRDFAIIIVF